MIDLIDRTVNKEGGDFDPERDIADWKINRWSYGYAHELTSTFDPSLYGPVEGQPQYAGRQPFRNVAIANSDSEAFAYTHSAINEAYRAVQDLPTSSCMGRDSLELDRRRGGGAGRRASIGCAGRSTRASTPPGGDRRAAPRATTSIAALALAAERGLPVAVRGGGTSEPSTVDGGIVDRPGGAATAIEIDLPSRTASVGGGVTWAELDEATQEHGLAVTGARLSGLGVAGVALGERQRLARARARPDGRERHRRRGRARGRARRGGDGEMLWALRGAAASGWSRGSTSGCIRSGRSCSSGFLAFPRERAAEVAPPTATSWRSARRGRRRAAARRRTGRRLHDRLLLRRRVEAGEEAVAPLRALGPSLDAVAPNPYRAFQRIWDASNPPGTRAHLRDAFLRELSDEASTPWSPRANLPAASLSYVLPAAARRCARRRRMGLSVRRAVAAGAFARSRAGGVGRRLRGGRRAVHPRARA